MSELLKTDMGLSPATGLLLDDEFTTDHIVGEAMAAWFKRVKQAEEEKGTPSIVGVMTKEQFQYAFKVSTELTSASPSGLHYTIWKALASNSYCAEILCIMIM